MPTLAIPEARATVPPTDTATLDAALDRLHGARAAWVATDLAERVRLLKAVADALLTVSDAWADAAMAAKGRGEDAVTRGEERVGGIMPVFRNLRLLIGALEAGGQPTPNALTKRGDRWIAEVFPTNLQEKLLFMGFRGEIWLKPGEAPTQGRIYRDKAVGKPGPGGVALVLGAGNQSSIGPMDALYKLFVEDEVVLLKMNPVNDYVGPFIRTAFQPLVERGFFEVCYGGADVGQYLCTHPKVDTIHITGSDRTYDAIVWGADPEAAAARKARGEKLNHRPITAELGCVTPVIVVPGGWSESDLAYQARHVASMVAHNASFNCNAAKVIVLASGWAQKGRFLDLVRQELRQIPSRKAYYPGAGDRWQGFLDRYPRAEILGPRADDAVAWTLIPDVPATPGEYAHTREAWCGIVAVTEVDGVDATSFLANAVPFCNDHLWGTLSCMLLIHPRDQKTHAAAFELAIADLRYGGIAVNAWAGVVYGTVSPTWGAFPGHTAEDIGSGTGVVHNTFLFDHPEKSVLYCPFRISPKPLWFADNRVTDAAGSRLIAFEHAPSWWKVPGIALTALRG